eukprot:NODE_11_length_46995_cov_0.451872.p26 type:complete len:131 gc:universal NODE_11_length_46995_cov_0.451872:30893-30501(-)
MNNLFSVRNSAALAHSSRSKNISVMLPSLTLHIASLAVPSSTFSSSSSSSSSYSSSSDVESSSFWLSFPISIRPRALVTPPVNSSTKFASCGVSKKNWITVCSKSFLSSGSNLSILAGLASKSRICLSMF